MSDGRDESLRIIAVDDSAPFLAALVDLLDEDGLAVVGTGADASAASRLAAVHLPDLALVDFTMPGGGVAAIAGILAASPDTTVFVLSAGTAEADRSEALGAGAAAYLVKGEDDVVAAARDESRRRARSASDHDSVRPARRSPAPSRTDAPRSVGSDGARAGLPLAEPPAGRSRQADADAALLAMATGVAAVGTWDWDRESRAVVWNPEHAAILGYEHEDRPRRYDEWASRVHPDDLERVVQTIDEAAATGRLFQCLYRVLLPDGTVRHARGQGRVVTTQPHRMVGVLVDVTDHIDAAVRERELLRLLHEAETTARQRIAANLHDGATRWLFAAGLGVDAVLSGVDRPADAALVARLHDVLGAINAAADALRVEMATLDVPRGTEPVDLAASLDALARAAFVGRAESVALGVELSELVPEPMADIALAIVAEALTNVRRHAEARSVSIDAARHGESIRLVVTDDGVGFDPAAGIGAARYGQLLMARRAQAGGGTAVVRSTPGAGTTVVIELPLALPEPGVAGADTASAVSAPGPRSARRSAAG